MSGLDVTKVEMRPLAVRGLVMGATGLPPTVEEWAELLVPMARGCEVVDVELVEDFEGFGPVVKWSVLMVWPPGAAPKLALD